MKEHKHSNDVKTKQKMQKKGWGKDLSVLHYRPQQAMLMNDPLRTYHQHPGSRRFQLVNRSSSFNFYYQVLNQVFRSFAHSFFCFWLIRLK